MINYTSKDLDLFHLDIFFFLDELGNIDYIAIYQVVINEIS